MPPWKVQSAPTGATAVSRALVTFTAISLSPPGTSTPVASNLKREYPPLCCPRYVPLTQTSATWLTPANCRYSRLSARVDGTV